MPRYYYFFFFFGARVCVAAAAVAAAAAASPLSNLYGTVTFNYHPAFGRSYGRKGEKVRYDICRRKGNSQPR